MEKLKLEVTERELREVNRCFHETLVAETKVNKKNTSESRLEQQSKQTLINPADVGVRDDIHLKLISESEARIDAEAKASYFEASAKVIFEASKFPTPFAFFLPLIASRRKNPHSSLS